MEGGQEDDGDASSDDEAEGMSSTLGDDVEITLKPATIGFVRAAKVACDDSLSLDTAFTREKLGAVPKNISDTPTAVPGDAFHFMDRIKVPMHHSFRKAYFVALTEAWYEWNEEDLERVKVALRGVGCSTADIEQKMMFQRGWFAQRVRRCVPSPSIQYHRVRAVLALFGNQKDENTTSRVKSAPLFHDGAWKRAKLLLNSILAGNCADPPNVDFYSQKLDSKGVPMIDELELQLLDCSRGTNDTECVHKQIVATFGSWVCGVKMADCLLGEFRHRYNTHISERRRLNFPKLGHCDGWLVDKLQHLVELNSGIILHPHWSNTSDYVSTPETFGTTRIHDDSLEVALIEQIKNLKLRDAADFDLVKKNLSRDQKYIMKCMGVELPFLPVTTREEKDLFSRLIRQGASVGHDALALEWMKHVDGKNIFPKLPVYIRTYLTKYHKSASARKSAAIAESGMAIIKKINSKNATSASSKEPAVSSEPTLPPSLPVRSPDMPLPFPPPRVGGETVMTHVTNSVKKFAADKKESTVQLKKGHGKRSSDAQPRKARRCFRCVQQEGKGVANLLPDECRGRRARNQCAMFNEDGTRKCGGV